MSGPRTGRNWPAGIATLGVRAQLVFWYTGIFALILLVAAGMFYGTFRIALEIQVDGIVRANADQIAARLVDVNGAVMARPPYGAGNAPESVPQAFDQGPGIPYGTLIRIVDAQGQEVYASPSLRGVSLPTSSTRVPLARGYWEDSVRLQGLSFAHFYGRPLTDHGQVYGALLVGQSLDLAITTGVVSGLALLALTPLLLAGGALGANLLGRWAFNPIRRLTAAARAVRPGDLGRRVDVPEARDEIRDLALTLNAMLERLDAASVAQRRFIADASHDLRSPIAAIRSLAENARDGVGPDDAGAALEKIARQSERVGRLLSNLFALARLDEGQDMPEREDLQLDKLVADVAESLRPIADQRGLALRVETADAVFVDGDLAQLILALSNVLDNALTYTPRGGSIVVSVGRSSADAEMAEVRVRDTGIGVADADLPHIFERFYRTDRARGHAGSGGGLGLAITKAIMEAHGGAIAVTSTPGVGSTFTLVFPQPTRPER